MRSTQKITGRLIRILSKIINISPERPKIFRKTDSVQMILSQQFSVDVLTSHFIVARKIDNTPTSGSSFFLQSGIQA
jgi:hypothetical protein